MDDKEDKIKSRKMVKYKLLQFHENYRPAYYGTWQKLSTVIQPRNPFKKDEVSCFNFFELVDISLRHYWIIPWTVMTNGRRRNLEKAYLTAIVE